MKQLRIAIIYKSINTVSTTLNEQFKGAEKQVADNVTRRITYFNIPQTIVQK